jgi:hypothetical protein
MQMGVDFVLALEHVCLDHHGVWMPELLEHGDLGVSGHGAMLQSPIMSRAPPISLDPFNYGRPSGSEWNVPALELERLLLLSQQIELTTEITPIQAWYRIKSHTDFHRLSSGRLAALGNELQPIVTCYG